MKILYEDDIYPAKKKSGKYYGKTIKEVLELSTSPHTIISYLNSLNNICISDEIRKYSKGKYSLKWNDCRR